MSELKKVVTPTTLKKGEKLTLSLFEEAVANLPREYMAVVTLCRSQGINSTTKKKFNNYYCYLNRVNDDGTIVDKEVMLNGVNKAISRKVKILDEKLLSMLEAKEDREFPLMLLFNDDKIEYKCDWDRDAETHKPKVDKYGNKHRIMFIYSVTAMVSKPKTFTSINDEDDLPF